MKSVSDLDVPSRYMCRSVWSSTVTEQVSKLRVIYSKEGTDRMDVFDLEFQDKNISRI